MSVRLDEIDLSSHDAFVEEVPLWAFRELRERDPVHWQPEPTPSKGFWAITRFRDIEEILRDTKTFSSAHGVTLEEQDDEEVEARASMIDMDPPNHSRLRRLVTKLVHAERGGPVRGFVREQARLVLDRGLPKGEFDFVEEISRELPIRVLARIMGVPDEDLPMCVELGDAMIAQADPEYSRAVIDKEDTSEYRLLPFRSPAAVELMAYGTGSPRSDGRTQGRPGHQAHPGGGRRRAAVHARVRQLLLPADRRRQRDDAPLDHPRRASPGGASRSVAAAPGRPRAHAAGHRGDPALRLADDAFPSNGDARPRVPRYLDPRGRQGRRLVRLGQLRRRGLPRRRTLRRRP
jgi:Cytochrome P450